MEKIVENNQTDSKIRFDFAARVHVYTHDYIRFADAKASAILAACGFIFTGLLTRADGIGSILAKVSGSLCAMIWIVILSVIGITSLIFTVGCCVLCIMPRLGSNGSGLVYWEQVAVDAEYSKRVVSLTGDEATKEIADHVKAVSGVAREKFKYVRRALYGLCVTLLVALIFSLVFIAISMRPTPSV